MASIGQSTDFGICINEALTDDELRSILAKLEDEKEKDIFGLVCRRWLYLQSTDRKRLAARAGPHMLEKMASRFTLLLELDLSQSVSRSFYPGVSDSDLSVIAKGFDCLKVLNLHNCKGVTDAGMVKLGCGLPSLQSLDISYCRKITDKGLSAVAEGCRNLRALRLSGCRFVTDKALFTLSMNCHYLEELCLQGCSNITDTGLISLANGCKLIKFLDMNKCINVGDIGVSSVAKACSSSLLTLKLLDCSKIGDDSISSMAEFCENLETLIIGGCLGISNESIMLLAAACKINLKNLRMDWCSNISDSSVSCILIECRNLEALDIGCCEEVTDAAFHAIENEDICLRLKVLKINSCSRITLTSIQILLRKCDCLEYLDVRNCPNITKAGCDEAGLQFPETCKVNFTGNTSEPEVLL